MMSQEEKATKIKALVTLLDMSMLFSLPRKELIKSKLETLSDDEIMGLGRLLATEHKNRDTLDKALLDKLQEQASKI